MHRLSKAAWVALGYAAAFGLACAAMAAHQAVLDTTDPQNAGGMQAFGDLLLFVGVFGVGSLLPTGLALYWLRQHAGFWQMGPQAASWKMMPSACRAPAVTWLTPWRRLTR